MSEKILSFWKKTKTAVLMAAIALIAALASGAGTYTVMSGEVAEAKQQALESKQWADSIEFQANQIVEELSERLHNME